jgi:glycerol-3-phosphate acyltransferase PlsY
MTNEIITWAVVIVSGYLLGSIPSAYLMGRLVKGIDMREVGDGHIAGSYAIRRLGFANGIIVGFIDCSKGALAVILALLLNTPLIVVLLAGVAAVAGHNWSIFLGFMGGQGFSPVTGVLVSLMWWPFLIALVIVAPLYFLTRRSTLASGIVFCILPLILWAERMLRILPDLRYAPNIPPELIVFPLFLAIPWFLKRPVGHRREQRRV